MIQNLRPATNYFIFKGKDKKNESFGPCSMGYILDKLNQLDREGKSGELFQKTIHGGLVRIAEIINQ